MVLIAVTSISLATATPIQPHTSAVAFVDGGWRIGERVGPPPETGVVRFTTLAPAPAPPPAPPSREVLGFAPSWTLDTWHEWRMQDLSTIAYFAVSLDGNGNVVADENWPAWQSRQLTDMVNAAHAARVRVLVTVFCHDEEAINSMVTDPGHMATAVQTAADLMRMRGLDGVAVDFEGKGDAAHPGIRPGMTSFVAALHSRLKGYNASAELVLASYSGSADNPHGIFDIGGLSPWVDAFFVMAYDMQFDNTPGHASATAPLQGGQFNDSDSVVQYLTETSADKVILGVPYYGYKWDVASPDANAATGGDPQTATYAQMLADFSCAQSLTRHDGDATPWATWYSPAAGDPCGADLNSWREIYFDTAATLGAKYDLVNRANLRGTGMWALGFDSGHTELWDALATHVTARH